MISIKKIAFWGLLVPLTALAFLLLAGQAWSAEKMYKLTLQAAWPRSDPGFDLIQVIADTAEKKSNGRLKIEFFADPEIVPADQLLDAVKLGTIDMASSVGIFVEGIIPIGGCETGLPMMYSIPWKNTHKERAEALREFYHKNGMIDILREEYAKHGHYYLDIFVTSPDVVLSKKPLKSLKDWKGKKVRADGAFIEYFDNVGAKGTPIPGTEAYMGLKLGTIDAGHWDIGAIRGMKWYEVAPYWDKGFESYIVCNFTMNLEKWKSLPEDLKEILRLATEEYFYAHIDMVNQELDAANKLVEEGALKVVQIDDQTRQALEKGAGLIWDKAAKMDSATAKAIKLVRQWKASHMQ